MDKPWNIVYIHTHDSGRYLSPYGYQVPTSCLERFAKESILFRNGFSAAPTCSPSRGALLTGQYPHTNGLIGLSHRGFSITYPEHHLVNCFNDAGYTTALAGIEHIANTTLLEQHSVDYSRLPYERILGPASESHDLPNAIAAANFIKEQKHSNKPFFLTLGLWNTHRDYPNQILSDYQPEYLQLPQGYPEAEETRLDFAHYCASVNYADKAFDILSTELKNQGLWDSTIVIFTTDHGLPSPNKKGSLVDEGIGVALLIRVPGSTLNGQVYDQLFSQIDLFPTLLDLVGLEIPSQVQGVSHKSQLMGSTEVAREAIFAETNYHCSFEPMRCVRNHRYKLIKRFHQRTKPFLANIDQSLVKQYMVDHGFAESSLPIIELYDLVLDPQETQNLAGNSKYQPMLHQLENELTSWMKETGDFLLSPTYTHPRKIALNPEDANHPRDKLTIIE